MFVLLWFLRSPRATGSVIALFALWYAGGRILTDFLRTDPRRFAGLTGSQLTSIVAIVAIVVALWLRARKGVDTPSVPVASPG
jgi:prolipoprotein diacylglyceryltransferase